MPRADREIIIDAPIDQVFGVIVDYERYPEFLPEMQAVEVLSRVENIVVVRFDLELIMRISYTLRLEEQAPDSVSWNLERAKMMTVNEGQWHLESTGEDQTRARYGIDIKLRGLIPKSVSTRLAGETLPSTLGRFKKRVESLRSRGG